VGEEEEEMAAAVSDSEEARGAGRGGSAGLAAQAGWPGRDARCGTAEREYATRGGRGETRGWAPRIGERRGRESGRAADGPVRPIWPTARFSNFFLFFFFSFLLKI
jgi:hypothetical protein